MPPMNNLWANKSLDTQHQNMLWAVSHSKLDYVDDLSDTIQIHSQLHGYYRNIPLRQNE